MFLWSQPIKKPPRQAERLLYLNNELSLADYIMPPMPPPWGIAGIADSFSGLSLMTHSVISTIPAMEAAFSRAVRFACELVEDLDTAVSET